MKQKKQRQPRRKTKPQVDPQQLDRRSFMRLAGLGAGVAGASIGLGAAEASASEPVAAAEQGGYRETEHVQTYYRMARF